MAKLFDSWRTAPTQVDSKRTTSNPLSHADLVKRISSRVSSLDTDDLITFIEANTAAMGRNLRDWRASRNDAYLDELQLAVEAHQSAVADLIRRSPLPGFGLSVGG